MTGCGDGHDFVYDIGGGYVDRLVLAGIGPNDITVTRSTSDLDDVTLSFAGPGSVFLSEQFYSNSYGVHYIDFADGTSWNRRRSWLPWRSSLSGGGGG
jgi:hypothetical protein